MFGLGAWVLAATFVFAAAGVGLVFLFAHNRRKREESKPMAFGTSELMCTVCQKQMTFTHKQLVILSDVEMALAVGVRPALLGKKLAEYVCPSCDAAHCFDTGGRRLKLVGVNLYVPQDTGNRCVNCHKHLKNPPWPPGACDGVPLAQPKDAHLGMLGDGSEFKNIPRKQFFDGNPLAKCPELREEYGLLCDRCGSVSCVECCQDVTKNRLDDGGLLCPRCVRGPLYKVYHFE